MCLPDIQQLLLTDHITVRLLEPDEDVEHLDLAARPQSTCLAPFSLHYVPGDDEPVVLHKELMHTRFRITCRRAHAFLP